ncbi:helix-turn-helix domain-containing protein [Desulfovibrio cuneatus]|uniref:helix-turn-helix domain-containing protein n=1 Tax=Desulfovibrio cuneatus TaxID=159728 RepID=UPI000483A68A|nr:helix-turn-helix domain-containing protein [Desulfovibrio cuneatus]
MWVSMHALQEIMGEHLAGALCNTFGGVPIYIPEQACMAHDIARAVGVQGMEALCASYPGEYITVPSGGVKKEQIVDMLQQGLSKRKIAQLCGVTERYVYYLASYCLRKPAKGRHIAAHAR